jgi:putative phosphoesterase
LKVALLGDIHANHLALAAVLAAVRKQGAERLLVTGDLVGYYFWPKEVLELLEPWDMAVVRGNHEDMLAAARKQPEILGQVDKQYGTGLRVALETLSSRQLDWLENLPHPLQIEIEGSRILICHGAPWDVGQYIYPDAEDGVMEKCAGSGHDWVVLGHTHYPMIRECGATTIVNSGSVGQPRNRKPGAHWALLDTQSRKLSFMSESYDLGLIIEMSRVRHPDIPYLSNVLQRGK